MVSAKRSVAVLLGLFCAAMPARAEEAPAKARWSVIQAGTLLAVPGKEPLRQQTILVQGDRIEQIRAGYLSPAELQHPEATLIDLREQFVLPGLMDMHVHLSVTPDQKRSLPDEAANAFRSDKVPQSADVYSVIDAIENARKTLQAGYTTVRNPGGNGWAIYALRDAIADGRVEGPRVFTAGNIIAIGTAGLEGQCYSVESCTREVRHQIDLGADLIKIYASCSGGKPCGSQDAAPLFLEEELRAVVATAKTRGLKVAAHAHGTAVINAALAAGVNSIEHGSFNDARSHELFRKQGAYLVPTLMVEDRVAANYPKDSPAMKKVNEAFMQNHAKNIGAAYRAGVKIAAGSDSGIVPHGGNSRELEWYVQIGLTPMAAIETATVNAAGLLGREKELGTIEPGKYADIIAVAQSPLEDIHRLANVSFVMKAGQRFK